MQMDACIPRESLVCINHQCISPAVLIVSTCFVYFVLIPPFGAHVLTLHDCSHVQYAKQLLKCFTCEFIGCGLELDMFTRSDEHIIWLPIKGLSTNRRRGIVFSLSFHVLWLNCLIKQTRVRPYVRSAPVLSAIFSSLAWLLGRSGLARAGDSLRRSCTVAKKCADAPFQ